MKTLLLPLLWLLAIGVALLVLWRWWHGRNVVLHGRWNPHFVRMVAIVLVVLGVGGEKGRSAPAPDLDDKQGKKQPAEELPPVVTVQTIATWLAYQGPHNAWPQFKQQYVLLAQGPQKADDSALAELKQHASVFPPRFRQLVQADLDDRVAGRAPAAVRSRELLDTLDELERGGVFDPWVASFLWRKSAVADQSQPRALIELYARLHRHALLANTLIAARAQVRPMVDPTAWRGKAGRPLGAVAEVDPRLAAAEMLKAAPKLYAAADAGTWNRDGLVLLTVAKESAAVTVVRAGRGQVPVDGQTFPLGRLDLIETLPGEKPVLLEHSWLGRVRVPAGRIASVWDLPAYLTDEGKDRAKKAVIEALAGNEQAANQVERALPLVHSFLREGLEQSPTAKGAARMRLIVSLFDDAVPRVPAAGVPPEDVPRRSRLPFRE